MEFKIHNVYILILFMLILLIYITYKYFKEEEKLENEIKIVNKKRKTSKKFENVSIHDIASIFPKGKDCESFLQNDNKGIIFCRV